MTKYASVVSNPSTRDSMSSFCLRNISTKLHVEKNLGRQVT